MIRLKWRKEWFHELQKRKHNTISRIVRPKSQRRGSGRSSSEDIILIRLRWKDTRLCFGTITLTAVFLGNMAQHRIPRDTGGTEAWVHLQQSNSDSQHQSRRCIRLECHLCHLVTIMERTLLKSKLCHPDMCIYILLFPALDSSILMRMPRIASAIQIWIQICWLRKEHPMISTQSAAWWCSWHPFCNRTQPIQRTWLWNEHWWNWTGFLSVLISTISRHLKVYFKQYIYMYYQSPMQWWRRKSMKTVQRLPKYHQCYTMPNSMIK